MTTRRINFTVYTDHDAHKWQTATFDVPAGDFTEFIYARVEEIVAVEVDAENEAAAAAIAADLATSRPTGTRIAFRGGWVIVNLPALPESA